MINNIYELENGRQYIVVAEENINNKKWVNITNTLGLKKIE